MGVMQVGFVAIGIAQGAIDRAVTLAHTKTGVASTATLRERPTFHIGLAEAVALVRGSRAWLRDALREFGSFVAKHQGRLRVTCQGEKRLDAPIMHLETVLVTGRGVSLSSDVVAACAEAGTDYLDLSGEPTWMRQMIDAHEAAAKASGARILFSCGFDSIPFELGVFFAQETAKAKLGGPVPRVKGRVRAIQGGLSGGTAASGRVTLEAMTKDPSLFPLMMSPFALTPGFEGPEQPRGDKPETDPDVGPVAPFMMAIINTKNVHRSNALMGRPWGDDFVYDEMVVGGPAEAPAFTDLGGAAGPQPGEGPTKAEREAGFYDIAFIGVAADGRRVKVAVKGDRDPGYGSTSKMIAETAICLVKEAPEVPGGVWTPGAALQGRLIARLRGHAGLSFEVEAA